MSMITYHVIFVEQLGIVVSVTDAGNTMNVVQMVVPTVSGVEYFRAHRAMMLCMLIGLL